MLKRASELYKGMSKKVRNKKTHKILDSDLVNMLVDKGSQYAINKLNKKCFGPKKKLSKKNFIIK